MTRAIDEEHRKEVWPQGLVHVEDGEVLTVNGKQVNCYSNPSATGSTLVSVCTVCHSLCDDVVNEFVAVGKSTMSDSIGRTVLQTVAQLGTNVTTNQRLRVMYRRDRIIFKLTGCQTGETPITLAALN